MSDNQELSVREFTTLIKFGRRGAGGDFDQGALSKLFSLGMIEIRSEDRRAALTERGACAYRELIDQSS